MCRCVFACLHEYVCVCVCVCVHECEYVWLAHLDCGPYEFPLCRVDKEMAQFLIGGDSPATQGHWLIICQLSVAQLRE